MTKNYNRTDVERAVMQYTMPLGNPRGLDEELKTMIPSYLKKVGRDNYTPNADSIVEDIIDTYQLDPITDEEINEQIKEYESFKRSERSYTR